jgi:hypothetical protein
MPHFFVLIEVQWWPIPRGSLQKLSARDHSKGPETRRVNLLDCVVHAKRRCWPILAKFLRDFGQRSIRVKPLKMIRSSSHKVASSIEVLP